MGKINREFYKEMINSIEKRIKLIENGQARVDLYDYEKKLLIDQLIQRIQDAEQALKDDFWVYTEDLIKDKGEKK